MKILCIHAHFDDFEFCCSGTFELFKRKYGNDLKARVIKEHKLNVGQLVYTHDNEVHGFKNTGTESFDILCIVPIRGER